MINFSSIQNLLSKDLIAEKRCGNCYDLRIFFDRAQRKQFRMLLTSPLVSRWVNGGSAWRSVPIRHVFLDVFGNRAREQDESKWAALVPPRRQLVSRFARDQPSPY